MTDLIGQKLGQYELVEVAGVGGLATVYKAYQATLERCVAVKVLHSDDKKLLARFKREAKAVAQLRHRNILIVYEYGHEAGWPYIAMEYVEQGTLEKYLTGKPMDWERVIMLTIPIARALHYAHEQGLIHRDVKPSNILMPQPDWPLLADFGLVKMTEVEDSLTETDVALGTPSYIPPEQAGAGEIDGRADMYSLGVLMFQMITGRLPFEYNNINLQIFAHLTELAPSPCELNSKCPPQLDQVIVKAMEKLPEDRYTNLAEMVEVLNGILKESTYHVSEPPPFRPEPPDDARATSPCSGSPTIRVLIKDHDATLDVPLPGEEGLIIGRSHKNAQADIDLGPYGGLEGGVSRRHARLIRQEGGWLIEDLGSMNGTYVNKTKLKPDTSASVKNGDLIRCGKVSFTLIIPD